MDTVNVEDESQWTFPPFAADIDKSTDRLIGRGACDNKGGIVCALYTLYALQQLIDGQSFNIDDRWYLLKVTDSLRTSTQCECSISVCRR